jgi:heme/copper-type cytochrome/quinol oxidase subunit 2
MKTTLKTTIIILLLTTFLSNGITSAITLTPDQASVRAFVSDPEPQAGDTITVSIFFQNKYTDALTITYVGLHFGWMPTDSFYGFNLSSTPITVAAGTDYFFQQPINIKIPTTTNGVQNYFAAIDGSVGTSSDTFSINSETAQIMVIGTGPTPTPTAPANTNSNGQEGQPNLLLYGAIAAVIVVVALLIIVMLLRQKRKQPQQKTEPQTTPSAEQKPSEQDFSI